METPPPTATLADAAGISKSYASEIVNNQRKPSRPLAIHIFRMTGWRHTSIADLSPEHIAMLETVEPWTPRTQQAAA
jgi:plasmid maintenance system antidote protein VapI